MGEQSRLNKELVDNFIQPIHASHKIKSSSPSQSTSSKKLSKAEENAWGRREHGDGMKDTSSYTPKKIRFNDSKPYVEKEWWGKNVSITTKKTKKNVGKGNFLNKRSEVHKIGEGSHNRKMVTHALSYKHSETIFKLRRVRRFDLFSRLFERKKKLYFSRA